MLNALLKMVIDKYRLACKTTLKAFDSEENDELKIAIRNVIVGYKKISVMISIINKNEILIILF